MILINESWVFELILPVSVTVLSVVGITVVPTVELTDKPHLTPASSR